MDNFLLAGGFNSRVLHFIIDISPHSENNKPATFCCQNLNLLDFIILLNDNSFPNIRSSPLNYVIFFHLERFDKLQLTNQTRKLILFQ